MTDTLKSCPFCNAPLELTPQEGMPEIKWLVHPVTGCMLDEWIMSADEEEMTTWNTRVPPKVHGVSSKSTEQLKDHESASPARYW